MKNWRVYLVFVIFSLILATVVGRLFFLQIKKGDFYKALSQGFYTSFNENNPERGEIFLAGGESLAINIEWPFVSVRPREVEDIKTTAKLLSEILDLDESFVLERLNQEFPYLILKRKLNKEEADALEELNLKGVYIEKEKGRYYPQEELASQLVGFLGIEGKGQYGLEQYYDKTLKGDEGNSEKGADLILTIDYNIQFEAEELLRNAKENLEIESGEIIVIEPDSGKILAMANFSNFNPNYYEKYAQAGELEVFKNKATQELFEPGSVFKPITMAAALEEGKISPKTTYIDEGILKIDSYTIENYHKKVYGKQTMTNVLEKSINTGAVFVQKQLGQNLFLKYVEKFGFFQPTGIDIQETYSQNKELKTGREINLATASFGQGIEMTPIQLVRAYCAIANGGELITPYIVEKIINPDDTIKIPSKNHERVRVISSKTASQLTAMLVSVVENGFGNRAKIPGYFVAGKTGTAQVSYGALGINKPGYSEKTIQTFIGFVPAFTPRFLILIKLDNPKTSTAEYSAAPIFRELARYIIHQYEIPPDYEE